MKKKCPKCGKTKLESDFHKDKSTLSGIACWCKECRQTTRKKWSDNNREKHLTRLIKYSQTPKGRYVSIKTCAKRRDIKFELTFEEYLENFYNKKCFYCGDKTQNGIDRVENDYGYFIGNCVPCCTYCNKMKLTSSHKEFINKCKKIIEHSTV